MKKALHFFVAAACFVSPAALFAQQNSTQSPMQHTGMPAVHSGSPSTLSASSGNPSQQIIGSGNSVQMTTCTDKVTYVDRHPQTSQDVYLGGHIGWQILAQTFPGYTGKVTDAYATMRKTGATCPVTISIYALDASNMPTGSPLATINVSVTSSTYAEYGGALSSSPTVTNGFAVGVNINSSNITDSAMVALHNDPDGQDFSYLFDGTTLYSANQDFSAPSDFLMRPKISFTAPTTSIYATPSSGCAGSPIVLNDNNPTGMPPHYTNQWAFVYNNPTFTTPYNWTFGDSNSSTSAPPVNHTYASSGTYTVTFTEDYTGWTTACPLNGGTTTVTINGATPTVSISASSTLVCTTDNVNFQATPTNGGPSPTYVWKKNGFQVGTGSTYSASGWTGGDQMVCEMTANGPCAPANPVVSNTITIYQQPGAVSSFNYVRNGLVVNFTSTSQNASTYTWDFGDAGSSNSPNPVHTYAAAGTYAVQLTVTNVCGTQNLSFLNIIVATTGNSSGGNTGVNEEDFKITAAAYPNPVNNDLNVVYSLKSNTDLTFEMMNSLGQLVSSQRINNTSSGTVHIPMQDLAPGVYFIRVKDDAQHSTVLHVVHQ